MKTKDFIELLEEYVSMSGDREISLTAREIGEIFDIDTRKCAAMLSYYRSHRDEFPSNNVDVMYMPIESSPGVWVIMCPESGKPKKISVDTDDLRSLRDNDDAFKEDILFVLRTVGAVIGTAVLVGFMLRYMQ